MNVAKTKKVVKSRFDLIFDQNGTIRRKINPYTIQKFIKTIFLLILLIGLTFIILYPFIIKFCSIFMSTQDTFDNTVALIPRHPTLVNLIYLFSKTSLLQALLNTLIISLIVAVCTSFSASLIGYGLAKFKFKGNIIVLVLIIFTLLVPQETILIPMYAYFRFFDIWGIIDLITSKTLILTDTFFPMIFLSITSMGFRGGLYILIMRQCFKGIPNELSEAAEVDGAGIIRTFRSIIFPLSKSMLVVVFILSFSWQWTDTFYASTLYSSVQLLPHIISSLSSAITDIGTGTYFNSLLINSAAIIIVVPLVIMFLFFQRKLVQGIARSGIVG